MAALTLDSFLGLSRQKSLGNNMKTKTTHPEHSQPFQQTYLLEALRKPISSGFSLPTPKEKAKTKTLTLKPLQKRWGGLVQTPQTNLSSTERHEIPSTGTELCAPRVSPQTHTPGTVAQHRFHWQDVQGKWPCTVDSIWRSITLKHYKNITSWVPTESNSGNFQQTTDKHQWFYQNLYTPTTTQGPRCASHHETKPNTSVFASPKRLWLPTTK